MSLNKTESPKTWSDLVEHGSGYLDPQQYQAFSKAVSLVVERLQSTLDGSGGREKDDENFDFSNYVSDMEERFFEDSKNLDDISKDASLTAFRVMQHLYDQLTVAQH